MAFVVEPECLGILLKMRRQSRGSEGLAHGRVCRSWGFQGRTVLFSALSSVLGLFQDREVVRLA